MLQNRVSPWGELCAVGDRGSLMGNRGILHDEHNCIVRPWAHKAWVTCLLAYKGLKRPKPFSPGNYSELFFLDEATALAAGHRPCTYCQRERSGEFKTAWLKGNVPIEERRGFLMSQLDARLHSERVLPDRSKRTHQAELGSLPTGAMFEHQGDAYLVADTGIRRWTFKGYTAAPDLTATTAVAVLTPPSVLAAFSQGFKARVHESALIRA